MLMKSRRIAFTSAMIGLLAGIAALPAGGSVARTQPSQDPSRVVTSASSVSKTKSASEIRAYWTEERMANAKALTPRLRGKAPSATVSDSEPHGSVVSVPATAPNGEELKSIGVGGSGSPETVGYSYPFPYTRYEAAAKIYKSIPHKQIGRLYFTRGGRKFVCSATALTSFNQSLVWTAGHCVHAGDGATWSTNVLFRPAFSGALLGPFGGWTANNANLWTLNGWASNGDLRYDLGAVIMNPRPSDGKKLTQVVGGLGFLANSSRVQHWHSIGYPAAGIFAGNNKQIVCAASHAVDDTGQGGPADVTMGIGCDATGGTSGGPWVRGYGKGGLVDQVNSVNSYGYNNQPGALYGPYHGAAAVVLYNCATDGVC